MIIELNTKLLNLSEDLNSNQLIFLSLCMNKNQKYNQDVRKIVSLISDEEIQRLISMGLITSIERGDSITYQVTDKVTKSLELNKSYFDMFYDMYPIYVLRPDGTKTYLRANVNKCRRAFETFCGKSEALAENIINCLKFEIDKKTREGKMGYFKTMWRWLVDHQWEETEEEMKDIENTTYNSYGTDII